MWAVILLIGIAGLVYFRKTRAGKVPAPLFPSVPQTPVAPAQPKVEVEETVSALLDAEVPIQLKNKVSKPRKKYGTRKPKQK